MKIRPGKMSNRTLLGLNGNPKWDIYLHLTKLKLVFEISKACIMLIKFLMMLMVDVN